MFSEGNLGIPAKYSNPSIGSSVPFLKKVLDIILCYFIYFFLFQEEITSAEDIFYLWSWKLICYQSLEARGVYMETTHPDAAILPNSAAIVK